MGHWCMENAGYLPGINLHQHDSGYFVHLYMYLFLLQTGTTALYFASSGGHIDIMKLLLNSGAQVNKVQHCNVDI